MRIHAAAADWIDPNVQWYAILVLLTVAVLLSVPWAVRVWKEAKGDVGEVSDTAEGLLGPLEEAFASGQMSEEEYHRIKSSVVKVAAPGKLSRLSVPDRPARPAESRTLADLPDPDGDGGGGD